LNCTFPNKNALGGGYGTDRGLVSTPIGAARRSPIEYHRRRLPSNPAGPLFRSLCPTRKEHRWIPIQGTRGPSGISPSSCYPTRASSPVFPPPVLCLPWGRPTGCSGLLKNPAGCAPPDRRAGERGWTPCERGWWYCPIFAV